MTKYAEVFPPGEFLKEELEARNWSQTEFAEIIGRPVRLVNELIAGKKSITPETAVQLSASLGTSAELWMNLESQYQLSKVPPVDDLIQRKAKLYEKFPVREMVKRGWVAATKEAADLERQVLEFFGIQSIDETPALPHAAKKTSYKEVTDLQWAWLFRAKQIAETQVVPKYAKDKLVDAISKLKALLWAPEEIRHVSKVVQEAGVRFVLIEPLPGSKIDGVSMWLSATQPVIAMSVRLDRIDNFWFVLRHEIEHILKEHGKGERLMIDENMESASSQETEEREANLAAQEFAVPDADLTNYMMRVNPYFFSEERVLGFASRMQVHPGIVVGRLHKKLEESDASSYRFLRAHLVKVRHIAVQTAPTDGWGNVYPVS